MKVVSLCLKVNFEIKTGGRSPELHNRKEMQKIANHLYGCADCLSLAAFRVSASKGDDGPSYLPGGSESN